METESLPDCKIQESADIKAGDNSFDIHWPSDSDDYFSDMLPPEGISAHHDNPPINDTIEFSDSNSIDDLIEFSDRSNNDTRGDGINSNTVNRNAIISNAINNGIIPQGNGNKINKSVISSAPRNSDPRLLEPTSWTPSVGQKFHDRATAYELLKSWARGQGFTLGTWRSSNKERYGMCFGSGSVIIMILICTYELLLTFSIFNRDFVI